VVDAKKDEYIKVLKSINAIDYALDRAKEKHTSMSSGVMGLGADTLSKDELQIWMTQLEERQLEMIGSTVELLAECDLGGITIQDVQHAQEHRHLQYDPTRHDGAWIGEKNGDMSSDEEYMIDYAMEQRKKRKHERDERGCQCRATKQKRCVKDSCVCVKAGVSCKKSCRCQDDTNNKNPCCN
jgi:hypothetical protein